MKFIYCYLVLFSTVALASAPSSVSVNLGRDNANGSFGGLDAEIGFSNGDAVFAGGSTSKYKESVAGGGGTATRSYYLGYAFNPDGRWSLTPSLDVWGARSDLTTRSVLVEVGFNPRDWSLSVQPEFKSLVWASADNPKEKKRSGAFGLHAHAEYLGFEDWSFELRAGSTNYGGQKFDQFLYSYYISDSAFAQSSGLVKTYAGLAVRYRLQNWQMSLKARKSSYLVGSTTSTSVAGGLKWRFHPSWRAGYELSSSKSSDSSPVSSNTLSLSFEW